MLALPVARPSAPQSPLPLSHPPILLHTTLFSWSQVRVRAGRFLLMQQTGRSLLILKYLTRILACNESIILSSYFLDAAIQMNSTFSAATFLFNASISRKAHLKQ